MIMMMNLNGYVFFLEVNDNENDNNKDDNDNDSDNDNSSEYIAIDISFPTNTTTDITTNDGHHGFWTTTKPIYFVLHGLHGGTNEEYIRDLTIRRNVEGSIVIVMIARGIMDTPIKGWNIFHGARTSDVHTAVTTIRKNLLTQKQQNHNPPLFIGVGYSMGAIIMSNYVATYGPECALDAAIAISGGLDMRYQKHAYRTQRLWQPMLAGSLRKEFLLGKFGHRVKAKLSNYQFLQILRASHITEIDQYAIVPLNGFDDLDHYYREMSALGDIPHHTGSASTPSSNNYKFHNISIPLLVVHALDDPLLSWRATVQNDVDGFMHPTNLVQSGSGNVLLLLTKSGGHVGWPLGLLPWKEKWRWMSDLVMSFATSVDEVRSAVAVSSATTTTTATATTTK